MPAVIFGSLALTIWVAIRQPMTTVEVAHGLVYVRFRSAAKVLAFASTVRIPVDELVSVGVVGRPTKRTERAWRLAGTSLPGVVHAGRFRVAGRTELWAIRRNHPALRIVSTNRILLVDVEDPEPIRLLLGPYCSQDHVGVRPDPEPHPADINANFSRRAALGIRVQRGRGGSSSR